MSEPEPDIDPQRTSILELLLKYQDWDAPEARQLLDRVRDYVELALGLLESKDKDIWVCILGLAIELEWYAVGVLWVFGGRPGPCEEFRNERTKREFTLGDAVRELRNQQVLTQATLEILEEVKKLRNSVVHRHAVGGVGLPGLDTDPRGRYRGDNVFLYTPAFRRFFEEALRAKDEMLAWLTEHSPNRQYWTEIEERTSDE